MLPALISLPLAACGGTYEQHSLCYGDGHQYGSAVYGA